jgi:hypothetical protein
LVRIWGNSARVIPSRGEHICRDRIGLGLGGIRVEVAVAGRFVGVKGVWEGAVVSMGVVWFGLKVEVEAWMGTGLAG